MAAAVAARCGSRLQLTYAFELWQVLRVTLKTDARNTGSRRAIERLGARAEGVRRAHAPASDGTVRDSAYYSPDRSGPTSATSSISGSQRDQWDPEPRRSPINDRRKTTVAHSCAATRSLEGLPCSVGRLTLARSRCD